MGIKAHPSKRHLKTKIFPRGEIRPHRDGCFVKVSQQGSKKEKYKQSQKKISLTSLALCIVCRKEKNWLLMLLSKADCNLEGCKKKPRKKFDTFETSNISTKEKTNFSHSRKKTLLHNQHLSCNTFDRTEKKKVKKLILHRRGQNIKTTKRQKATLSK